jgi:glycosyltransferase involved in cell wall biosynthesis
MKKNILIITSIFSGRSYSGSDRYTHEISNLLSIDNYVTICTTTSQDYVRWDSHFTEGFSYIDKIKINRFKPNYERNISKFNKNLRKLIKKKNVKSTDYEKFIIEQGPLVPKMIEYIKYNLNNFDIIIFIGYLYYPIVYGIPLCKNKSIIIPTLHDEIVAYFPIYKDLLSIDLIYSFNTPEELEVYKKIYNRVPEKYSIIGTCITLNSISIPDKSNMYGNYILYVGRVDSGKGVGQLISFFKEWKKRFNSDYKLLIAGGGGNPINSDLDIVFLGYVTEDEKYFLIKNSIFLINPSPMESFSIIIMEAWLFKKAVIVNSMSDTMKNHCLRANAGLYYTDIYDFLETLNFFIQNPIKRNMMGENGKRYVEENYSPKVILSKFEQIFSYFKL